MYSVSKFTLVWSATLTLFVAGLTVHGFGDNITTYAQLVATAVLALAFFIRLKTYKRERNYDTRIETIPDGPITRDMTDPLSQTMWKAFDSGNMVSHNAGDDFMTTTDKDGKKEKIKLK